MILDLGGLTADICTFETESADPLRLGRKVVRPDGGFLVAHVGTILNLRQGIHVDHPM